MENYYIIPSNAHSSGFRFSWKPFHNNVSKLVKFEQSCLVSPTMIYPKDNDLQLQLKEQLNKLFGIGFLHHHYKSLRFCFSWGKEDTLKLWIYYYHKWKERKQIYLGDIKIDTRYIMGIKLLKNDKAMFYVEGPNISKIKIIDFELPWFAKFGAYGLYPYYGGELPAPHQMEIYLKDLG